MKVDPRIENVLEMIENWRAYDRDAHEKGLSSYTLETMIEGLLKCVDFTSMTADEWRGVLSAIAGDSEEILDAFSDEANDERRVYMQCTVGHDIADVLAKVAPDLNSGELEKLANQVLDDVKRYRDEKPAEVTP